MPRPGPESVALGELYRLGLAHVPRRGPAGERLGRGTGSSLEFQDRRAYAPGDDVRHVDWRALARTDQLFVRQYREEILPQVDLLVDASRSMAVDDAKAELAVRLVAVLSAAAAGDGYRVSLVVLGDRPEPRASSDFLRDGIDFTGERRLTGVLADARGLLHAGSVRLLVSDFLTPHVASELVRGLARGSGGLGLIQLLARDDAEPPVDAALRLTDAESGESLDLVVEGALRERYLARLGRLTDALQEECARQGATWLRLDAATPLEEHCRGALLESGLLVPA